MTAMEKFVLKLSRKSYMESLKEWKKNFKNLPETRIKLNTIIESIVRIGEKKLPPYEAYEFRNLFETLTMIGYRNLQIYYISTKSYLEKNGRREITIDLLKEAKSEIEFLQLKKELYADEQRTKDEIRIFFKDKRIKNQMAFYSFAFEFLDKIRMQIQKKDMEKMKLIQPQTTIK
jgi:hypothetical protein